jgi:S-adenosylmethionine decarboxylase
MKKEIGNNLIIDVYDVEKHFLSKNFLLTLLKNLIKLTKSNPVGKPVIKKNLSEKYSYVGYSIFQIIKESHISFHTWPEYNYLAIDIFSCKKFNSQKILSFLKSTLNKEAKIKSKEYKRIVIY